MSADDASFAICPACGEDRWRVYYDGPVRAGRFGTVTGQPARVLRCEVCGTGRLTGVAPVDYEGADYRERVDGDASADAYHTLHDAEQAQRLLWVGTDRLRGRVVADVGCGAGSFLDFAGGVATETIAIEPATGYHDQLAAHGHVVAPYCVSLDARWRGTVDLVTCFSVVEHVDDPLALAREMRALLRSGGELLLSTPNLDDWLIELLPDDYAAFFYRVVHLWYFDAAALRRLLLAAGFASVEVEHRHRFDLANLLLWLRDRRPTGADAISTPSPVGAALKGWLEASGRADYLLARATA